MRLEKLSLAGYRSFAARSPVAPDRELQKLALARLVILLGKNNSGKSTLAQAIHHILFSLGSAGDNPLPMKTEDRSFGNSFRDIQHGGKFFNPLDLSLEITSSNGESLSYTAQLIQKGELDDSRPVINDYRFGSYTPQNSAFPFSGLLPALPETESWRIEAAALFSNSCRLQPVRDSINFSYQVKKTNPTLLPINNENVAQLLLSDLELRSAVGDWIAENLEGWKIDINQSLDTFKLVAKRGGREINLCDSGQGIQQILPVVTLCLWRKLNRGKDEYLDVIEQPELHLHDAAHASLADLAISSLRAKGTLLVETHSEEFVLRIRRRIAEGALCSNSVTLMYIEDLGDGSQMREIEIEPDGEISWWPTGIFSEALEEVKAIRRAQKNRKIG